MDEADLVKTHGRYIYQVNGRRVLIVRAHPPESMAVAAALDLAGEDLDRPERPLQVATYLGGGEIVYASARNL